jgi:ketosteroid isomerase-like protein
MLAADVDTLMPLHTEDTMLELPGAEGLPAAGTFNGRESLRAHLSEYFHVFRVRSVRDDDFLVHAVDEYVFLRTTTTIEYLPTNEAFTARHVNEFEFRDGQIARRVNVADWDALREILER